MLHVLVFADEAFDDAQLGLDLGRLDVERAAGVESRFVAFVDVDVLRRAVGGENDLLALACQLVEYLEHDVERLLLALQLLDVVDKEDVGFLVVHLEVLVAGLLRVVRRRCVHVVLEQLIRVFVDDLQVGHVAVDVVLYGPKQMRLAQARPSVDEQRV